MTRRAWNVLGLSSQDCAASGFNTQHLTQSEILVQNCKAGGTWETLKIIDAAGTKMAA